MLARRLPALQLQSPLRRWASPRPRRHFHRPARREGRPSGGPQRPSRPSSSIFEELFPEEPKGETSSPSSSPSSALKGSASDCRLKEQHPPPSATTSPLLSPASSSLFEELFPGEQKDGPNAPFRDVSLWSIALAATEPHAQTQESSTAGPSAVREDFTQWLRDTGATTTEAGEANPDPEPTVLVLSGTTASLLPSDFFRLAPRGRHVDGWAGGLQRVVQARDPATLAARGRYFLFFDGVAPALAYLHAARDLQYRAQEAALAHYDDTLPPHYYRPRVGGGLLLGHELAGAVGGGRQAQQQQQKPPGLEAFALAPPSGQLDIALRLPPASDLGGNSNSHQEKERDEQEQGQEEIGISSSSSNTTPEARSGPRIPTPDLLRNYHEHEGSPAAADAAAAGGGAKVLVSLEGDALSAAELRGFVAADGAERNLPWKLRQDGDIVPVGRLVASRRRRQERLRRQEMATTAAAPQGGIEQACIPPERMELELEPEPEPDVGSEGEGDVAERDAPSSRFVLAFAEAVEAHRFVRGWHRRTLHRPRGRSVVVNASYVW